MPRPPSDPELNKSGQPAWPGKAYPGQKITVYFDAGRCRHFAECVRGLPAVFDTSHRPWIDPDGSTAERVAEIVRRCPSGALHYTDAEIGDESPDAPTIVTAMTGGPLLVRGDLRLVTDDSTVIDTRFALCRCGRSDRQPFCDAACETDLPT